MWIVVGSLLVILIAFRIALPYILLRFVNKELQTIPGYTGHVDDIDVALIRGAYTIKTIKLDKTGGKIPVPFFSAETIDLSVEWKALFHRRIVGKIIVQHPIINFAKGPTKETSQTEISTQSWTAVVGKLMPLKINRFEILDGEVHYRDFASDPKVNIYATEIHILATNLSNALKQPVELPSTVEATCNGIYGGHASLHMKLAWESLIGVVNWVVKNKGKDQLATRIEFSGDLRDPNINTWYIIGQVLRNGFIQALYPALENSVNINSVNEVKITNVKVEKKKAKEEKKDKKKDDNGQKG